MPKYSSKSPRSGTGYTSESRGKSGYASPKGGKLVERDLCATNPLTTQFEPTGAEPVRAHYKMAGGA